MEFIEASAFARALTGLLSDDAYSKLQRVLTENPELGPGALRHAS
jgi:hypothetical protein